MSKSQTKTAKTCSLIALGLILGLGCSTDSPTAPVQTPAPPPGTEVSAIWNITVSTSPREVTVDSTDPVTVDIRVRDASTNQAPPTGTTIVISTTLGEFGTPGSGLTGVALGTANGRASVLLFPGSILGTALITAQLESSAGQKALPIVSPIDPVVAAFAFLNSNGNLSVRFQNLSTGNPTRFLWEFGDGATSNEEHPVRLYRAEGDYVVVLTASKKNSSDTTSQLVSVTEDPDKVVEADFTFTVADRTVVFQDTSTGDPTRFKWDFGDGTTSTLQNPTHLYPSEGSFVVTLTAENSRTEDTTSQTVTVSEDPFIVSISPGSGPASGGTTVTITGQGFVAPLQVFFGDVLATFVSNTGTSITVISPPGALVSESCDDDGDMIEGTRFFSTAVPVRVELSSGSTEEIPGGFVFVPASGSACVGD